MNKPLPGTVLNSSNSLLFSEILDKVHKAKTKDAKVEILKKFDNQSLRMVIKSSFDPKIVWELPEGDVPFKPNDAPAGTEHTRLASEAKKLYHYIKGGDNDTPKYKKELMFVQLLEGLHETEAKLVINAKDKKLHQVYKGLSKEVVKEAFGWTEEYMLPDDDYPGEHPRS